MELSIILLIVLSILITIEIIIIKRIMTTKDIADFLLNKKKSEKVKIQNKINTAQKEVLDIVNNIENKVEEQENNLVEKTKTKDLQIQEQENNDQQNKNILITDNNTDNEVFHVGNNKYTYEEAPAVCETLGARLATEEELKRAWKNGANWCSYGWTQGQKGMFPIQQEYWNTRNCLVKNGEKNPCGEVGINGGVFPTPHHKFGVNCYGKKPERSEAQIDRERKWLAEKNRMDALSYREFSKEELDVVRNNRYEKILKNMKKEILVNEIKEFDNLKVKWSRIPENNVLPKN